MHNVPIRLTILSITRKLETTGPLINKSGKHTPAMSQDCVDDVRGHLVNTPKKSLCRLSHETGYPYGTCQTAANKLGLQTYRVHVTHELKEPDAVKQMHYCQWLQTFHK